MSKDRTEYRLATLRERLDAGMNRREFIRTIASAGYAVGVAGFLGVEDFLGVDDGDVPVVTALVRSDPDDPFSLEERIRTVPADWYAAVSKAIEVNQRLAQIPIAGYLGSTVVPGTYDSGTASVSVVATANRGSIGDTLESLFDGVSFHVEPVDDVEGLDDIGNIDDLEDGMDSDSLTPRVADSTTIPEVPGGVACVSGPHLATLGPALYDPKSGGRYFSTAEHAFRTRDGGDQSEIYLPTAADSNVRLGSVVAAYPIPDVAVIEPDGPLTPSSMIDGRTPVTVRGQFTRFGLADLAARDQPLEKVGSMTGHTSGSIQGIDAITCVTDGICRHGQLRWGEEMDLTDGDSGSVSYRPDPDAPETGVLIAGFNNARTWWPGQSYVWGTAAYRFTEIHGYHF